MTENMCRKERRALVTGGTCDDVAPIATFVINVSKTNSHLFDEIVVYHNGIKLKDQELIKRVFPTRFIDYSYHVNNRNDEVISYFSPMIFCKYECFGLLSEYDEVVWSDYDVVIRGKLDDFCQINGAQFNILECEDSIRSMFYKDYKSKEIDHYNLDIDGVSTPLFALSSCLPEYERIKKWCYEKTDEWIDDIYLPEQCIFSLAIQEFGIDVNRFSFMDYACYPTESKGTEKIIHASGQPKFWNGMYDNDWEENYSMWIQMGGTPYHEWKKKLKRRILFLYTRLIGIRFREHG